MRSSTGPLAKRAGHQHGLFTAADASSLGVTHQDLRSLVATGWCDRARPGVYRVVAAPRTQEQDLLAVVLFHGAGTVASHRSAAALWGMPGYRMRPSEVTRLHERNRRSPGGLVHGVLLLPDVHCTVRTGIPVTTVSRTIFDLAGIEHIGKVERALDTAIHRRLCTLLQLQHVFFALAGRGRRGTVAMRELLEARGEDYVPPASELERVARRVFADASIPLPRFEVHLGDAELIGRVDCFWRDAGLVVELDGRRYHGGLLARDADRKRDNRLMAEGWRVLRITWDDLRDRPQETAELVRRALRART